MLVFFVSYLFWAFLGGGIDGKVREPGLEHGTPEAQRHYMSRVAYEAFGATAIFYFSEIGPKS